MLHSACSTHALAVCVQDGCRPLYVAAEKGRVHCMELLLGKGAEVDQTDCVGEGLGCGCLFTFFLFFPYHPVLNVQQPYRGGGGPSCPC